MRWEKTPEERFWSHVKKTKNCWNWDNTKHHRGYGKIRMGKKKVFAHRFSYELHNGYIPEGLQIDHICRNKACVNPLHLEAVNHRENVLRGIGPTAINYRKKKCKHGHSLIDAYIRKGSNYRKCKPCVMISQKKTRNRRKLKIMAHCSPNL